MATKAKVAYVTKGGQRHIKLMLPSGEKVRYDVPLNLTQADIESRAAAWLGRNHPGVTLAECHLAWNPEFVAVEEGV